MTFQGEVSPPFDWTNKTFSQSHVEFHKFWCIISSGWAILSYSGLGIKYTFWQAAT